MFGNFGLLSMKPETTLYWERSVISFLVVDSADGDSARGDYTKNIPGVVRPLLEWSTEFSPDIPLN